MLRHYYLPVNVSVKKVFRLCNLEADYIFARELVFPCASRPFTRYDSARYLDSGGLPFWIHVKQEEPGPVSQCAKQGSGL